MADFDGAGGLRLLGFEDRPEQPEPPPNRRRRRRGLDLSIGLILLALLVWGVVVVTRPAANVAVTRPAVKVVTRPAAEAEVAPARLLQLASARAAAQPDLIPQASQFWYVHDGSYQAWLSIDGQHDGLVITNGQRVPVPGCVGGQQAANGNSKEPIACVPDPAYLADAPTDAAAMRAFVDQAAGGAAGPDATAKEMLDLLQMHYLRPAARAALFDATATPTGLTPIKAGTHGLSANQVGVSIGGGTSAIQLVFDAGSHDFISVAGPSLAAGLPSFGLVDQVGQTA